MHSTNDKAEVILADPAASEWLKAALRSALPRDPVDTANDALALAEFLARRADDVLATAAGNVPAHFMSPADRRQGLQDRDPFVA